MINQLLEKFQNKEFPQENQTNLKLHQTNHNNFKQSIYENQFEKIFQNRLDTIKRIYEEQYNFKFTQIKNNQGISNDEQYMIGIIQKNMYNQKSYLKEIENPKFEEFLENKTILSVNKRDTIYFEDDGGKIQISNKIVGEGDNTFDVNNLVSGSVVAIRGEVVNQKLFVKEVIFLKAESHKSEIDDKIIIISSPQITKQKLDMQQYDVLFNILTQQSVYFNQFQTVIFFGGLFGDLKQKNLEQLDSFLFKSFYQEIKGDLDYFTDFLDNKFKKMAELKKNIIIIPSLLDPINTSLPQNKFHRILFPQTYKTKSIFGPNPSVFDYKGKDILFLDGAFVIDYQNQTNLNFYESAIIMLRQRLICPTAPNTIAMIPDQNETLIIKQMPSIVFVSNSPEFQLKNLENTKIYFIPCFEKTNQIITFSPKQEIHNIL